MSKKRLSLSTMIGVFGLVVATLPLILYLVVSLYSSAKMLQNTHEKELLQQNLLTATLINQSIAEKISALSSLSSQLSLVDKSSKGELVKFLQAEIDKRNDISGVAIYSDELVFASRELEAMLPMSEVVSFISICEEADFGETLVSSEIFVDDSPFLFFCTKERATAIIAMNFDNIKLLLTQFDDELEGENPVMLVSRDDEIIFSTVETQKIGTLDQRILDTDESGVVLRDALIAGERSMVAIEEINEFGDNFAVGWKLIAPLSEKTINAKMIEALKLNLLLGLFIIALVFVAAILLAKLIIKPLKTILPMAQAIKDGDYSSRIELASAPKEIDIIVGSLNEMANRVERRTVELKEAKEEVEELHKLTRDSIEFASLLQHAIIPQKESMDAFFDDCFVFWQPKDVVGGDIYFFEEIEKNKTALLIVADCTGHGVPGAFVTMLVKAVEKEIVTDLKKGKKVTTSEILQKFNRDMKQLLAQDDKTTLSNSGFDGVVLLIDKEAKKIEFAGANLPLNVVKDDKLEIIRGDRESIGYKKSKDDFVFTSHTISYDSDTVFYITTDGFVDQNGGKNGFPFGRKKFNQLVEDLQKTPLADQKEIFINELATYQANESRNDDITLMGLKLA